MATLSILRFSTAGGVAAALDEVRVLSAAGRLAARDLAMMSWEPGQRVPETRCVAMPLPNLPMGPSFWNLLFGHLFFLPAAAAAAGAALQSMRWSLAGLGIRDDFLLTARERLTPGTSALFVLTDDANVDPVIMLLGDLPFTVTSTNLSTRQLESLQMAFGSSGSDVPLEIEFTPRARETPDAQ
ncbi:MAG TPA: DUF1269 domain-containing protein [Xanthomonadales bacterium]|nr:DUF1269 domain-containing protein [Xanthomonadales bacterium]